MLGLRAYAKPVTPVLLLDGTGVFELDHGKKGPPVSLAFGTAIRRGDIMLIDYAGFADSPRTWDHVAIVSRDQGTAGVFDPRDLVMHMGYLYGLVEAEAQTEGPARVQFLRWRPDILRRIGPHPPRLVTR